MEVSGLATKKVNSKMFIETEHRKSGNTVSMEFEEKSLGGVIVSDKHAMVEGKIGMTISLGNYEFLRIDAGVTIPCEKAKIEETYEEAFSLAGAELFKRVDEAKKTLL